MAITDLYADVEPTRERIDALSGPAVVEFGTPWCGYCRAAQAPLVAALAQHPGVHHLKIEDGPGRPLGRSFRVRLWPTLIFLHGGGEVARLVRPRDKAAIANALARIDPRT